MLFRFWVAGSGTVIIKSFHSFTPTKATGSGLRNRCGLNLFWGIKCIQCTTSIIASNSSFTFLRRFFAMCYLQVQLKHTTHSNLDFCYHTVDRFSSVQAEYYCWTWLQQSRTTMLLCINISFLVYIMWTPLDSLISNPRLFWTQNLSFNHLLSAILDCFPFPLYHTCACAW